MKFSSSPIALGTKARKSVPFPTEDGPLALPELDGDKVVIPEQSGVHTVDVRCLSTRELSACYQRATAFAKTHGVDDPKEGNSIYDLAVMAEIVFAATLDHDATSQEPYFDGGVAQVYGLDQDRLVLLYELQVQWQAQCSPRRLNLDAAEFISLVTALAVAEDDAPFSRMPLATQQNLLRILAKQWWTSLRLSQLSTLDSVSSGTTITQAQTGDSPAAESTE